jgi:hypothetical protein
MLPGTWTKLPELNKQATLQVGCGRRLPAQFSIEFHVLEPILNHIPKRTWRLRVQQLPINKLRHMYVTVRMSLAKLDIQCPPLFIILDGFNCRRIESDPLRHSPH